MAVTVERIDPYVVLGLSPQATQEEIRRAYRTLVRQDYPDTRTPGDPANGAASNSRLQQAIAAYMTLGDPARRAEHDQSTTQNTDSRPTRVARSADGQPPIQAGPVHWHLGPRPGNAK
jgi:curved DNA-binding protein CbpA